MTAEKRNGPLAGRWCPTGGRCPSSPSCPHYPSDRKLPPHLAWCLLTLPPGYELTQTEAAATLGISVRQLSRIEASLLQALGEVRDMRALAIEYGILSSENEANHASDVRSGGRNMHDGQHGSRADDSMVHLPVSFPGGNRRASLCPPGDDNADDDH